MLCWLCKPTEIEPQKPYLESCVKKKKKNPQQQQRPRAPLAAEHK